jgi:hypothetical protein
MNALYEHVEIQTICSRCGASHPLTICLCARRAILKVMRIGLEGSDVSKSTFTSTWFSEFFEEAR